jgi:hypothetical protein
MRAFYTAFIERARREGVRHVIVNQRDFRYMNLRPLLDEHEAHPGLRLAYADAETPEHKILVYDVVGVDEAVGTDGVEQRTTPRVEVP